MRNRSSGSIWRCPVSELGAGRAGLVAMGGGETLGTYGYGSSNLGWMWRVTLHSHRVCVAFARWLRHQGSCEHSAGMESLGSIFRDFSSRNPTK